MTLIWRMPSNNIIMPVGHVPDFREPNIAYQYDNCFNCGGEFFIELGSAEFGFDYVRCPVCGGNGEVLVGFPPYDYYEWVDPDIIQPPVYLFPDGKANWHPD